MNCRHWDGTRTAGQDAPGWSEQLNWFHKIRLRVLAVLLAGIFAVIGVVTWAAWPVVPVVGVALLTVAAVVNQMTSRLGHPVCYQCGADLKAQSPGVYGVVCPGCGAVNEALPDSRLASSVNDAETPDGVA
ncbi:MAG: hypothetical protein H6810_00050 [Phycisphaeraceae bacterium]|nr:MAG: hypothetical protein H6810_00050 [Phycisphaeraceae bacterium]